MAYGLALTAAVVLGIADFCGGIASRRDGVLPVMTLSRLTGLAVLTLALAAMPASTRWEDLAWGSAAGICGSLGLALLYHTLANGPMSSGAPAVAVLAAAVPVVAGLVLGERPARETWIGVAFAFMAIAFLSSGDDSSLHRSIRARLPPRAVVAMLASGILIGLFYVLLSRAASSSRLWPLVGARLAALVMFVAFGLMKKRQLWPTRAMLPVAVVASILDILGTVLYLLAVHQGPLALVALLTSLYPVSTVCLAMWKLNECLTRRRAWGFTFAALGVALIVVS